MPNYILLEKITVGAAGASSVTFSSIPQTGYTDLVVKLTGRNTSSGDWFNISFNGSTANFNTRNIFGTGGVAVSNSRADGVEAFVNNNSSTTASTFSSSEIYIPNYTSSSNKSFSIDSVTENNGTTAYSILSAGLWSNSAAITSITLTPVANSLAQYSTFYLYGVAKLGTTPAIVPYATGGDTIMTDGTYWYHTFLSSGTFTPQKGLSCDYLVIAGGGAGWLGGGGAGGFRSTVTATGGGGSLESPLSLASGTGYTVTIGGGGASQGNSGSNSVFATITSIGGGKGAATGGPATGGSGGGGGYNEAGASGTANQGYAGGNGSTSGGNATGGGGGAGAVGTNSASGVGGNGGAGVASSISGSSVTRAGGGGAYGSVGAGTGGAGGGGNGSPGGTGGSGTVNTGSGGGGGGSVGGAGGSGLVIVRYAV